MMAQSNRIKDNNRPKTEPQFSPKLSEYEQNEIIYNFRQRPTGKQPAQERLKRLQGNLKKTDGRKLDKASGSSSAKKSSANSSSINAAQSKATARPTFLPNRSATTTTSKPKALFDAGNKLNKSETQRSSGVANQRLAELRNTLQQRQKEANNNNNNERPAPATTTTATATAPLLSWRPLQRLKEMLRQRCRWLQRRLCAAPRGLRTSATAPAPVSDSVEVAEPMDWEEEEPGDQVPQQEEIAKTDNDADDDNEDYEFPRWHVRPSTGAEDLPERRVDHMYFVLDTNVLVHNLVFVEELAEVTLPETSGSMLYIPYMVIKELDKLKDKHRNDNESTRSNATRAIRYLNTKFDYSLGIQAQSAIEEAQHLIEVDSADDSIVNCCLQLQEQVPHMMLLTNDANLRLKANASAIQVSCRSDLLSAYPEAFAD